jgi:hypothetical protein
MADSGLSAFLAAFGFAGWAPLAGPASASFGVSAKAVPETRNIDNASAASFFISSLFGAKFDLVRKRAYHPAAEGKGSVLQLRQLNINIL